MNRQRDVQIEIDRHKKQRGRERGNGEQKAGGEHNGERWVNRRINTQTERCTDWNR